MAAREIELINDRDLARQRLAIFAGMDRPSTIVRKELIDNEIDVVSERGQRANECCIKLGPNRIVVMDNGSGISTKVKPGTDKTHLWLACAKMFSSSNYGGVSDSVGANGVGLTIANYTSRRFAIGLINRQNVEGYQFIDGYLAGSEECQENVRMGGGLFDKVDMDLADTEGDMVKNPLSVEEGKRRFEPFYEIGFVVDATWFPSGTMQDSGEASEKKLKALFPDTADLSWLAHYVEARAGELKTGNVHMYVYGDDEFLTLRQEFHWTKDAELNGQETPYGGKFEYAPSWREQVDRYGAVVIKNGPWQVALSTNPEMKVTSIVQGAPIEARTTHRCNIQIQDYSVAVEVPVSLHYLSTEYPAYQDQTKTNVRFPYNVVAAAFERAVDVYRHFYREAEKAYMAKVIADSDSSMFWPALGEPSESELIIAEGYSAISGLKSQRDPMTQACIALRGKILNCWNLDMQKAMRAKVVKQILNAAIYTPYKRIIIAVDEDYDGSHICSLLLALFGRFTNLIQEGKVYRIHSPHYLFKKRGAELRWSDEAKDCPNGYHVTTLKGLGGMTQEEIQRFIMNEDTRELIQIEWDKDAWEALDHAFSDGGESWIA